MNNIIKIKAFRRANDRPNIPELANLVGKMLKVVRVDVKRCTEETKGENGDLTWVATNDFVVEYECEVVDVNALLNGLAQDEHCSPGALAMIEAMA